MAMKSPNKTKQEHRQSPPPSSPGRNYVEAELGIQPVRRPMGIDQDVSDLGQKKRVSSVLTSPMFKEELETVVTDLLRSGDGGGQVIAREIANMLSPHSFGYSTHGLKTGVGCVSPINDITGSDIARYTKGEKLMRCKLAALYRLVDLNGWSMQIFNHISLRVDKEQEHFLINPFGLMYHEVSAAKLMKINMQGDVIDHGTTNFPLNKAGFLIHSAIHSGRPDLNCVIHVHVADAIAVSMMEGGLLPISQEACIVGDVSIHPYQGIVVDQKEKKLLIKHLGPTNKVMLLKNHGMIACGETVEEAFFYLYHTIKACETQVKILSCYKLDKSQLLDKSVKAKVQDTIANNKDTMDDREDSIKWGRGEMMFEAYMRMLDNMGYRTGYAYKNTSMMQRRPRLKGEVELPGTAHGHTIPLDDIQDGRSRLHSPASHWVNSPNQYTKVRTMSEEEASGRTSVNGDVSPKNKTKWRSDEDSSHSTPIKIADPNQFVPKNTDPREVLEKRKQIRGQGMWDERGPGPQSQKLDAVQSTDRRAPMQCFADSFRSTAYDSLEIGTLDGDGVFTGSKGIIQKDYHAQTVVAGPPNPFTGMKSEDLEKYKLEVSQKIKRESGSEDNFATKEETVEHTIEVVAHVPPETVKDVQEKVSEMQQESVVTNGHSEPEETKLEEPVVSETVTDSKPPVSQEPVSVNNNNKAEVHVEVTPTPEPPQVKNPSPKEMKKNNSNKQKVNGGETTTAAPAPKAQAEVEEPVKPAPGGKNDSKGKHKEHKSKEQKKQKRRSLSFLKKNKEKKEKE